VGVVAKVAAATVSDANTLNSFLTFDVAAGATANLYVPSGATSRFFFPAYANAF
jgi:hypothetical protein